MNEEKITLSKIIIPIAFIAVTLVYFLGFEVLFEKSRGQTMAAWSFFAWNEKNEFIHGRAIPIAFIIFTYLASKKMRLEPLESSRLGLTALLLGLVLYLAAARTLQPRLGLVGLPFMIIGSLHYVCGWKMTRHMLFPAFFWYFAIPIPSIQQATSFLQVFVTQASYNVGVLFGMDILNTGNVIRSASSAWDVDIAAGCSGIRSLMALVMVAAIYAYYTQKTWLKRFILFSSSIPLALLGNFLRIFTILVFSEMGQAEFATGLYHDWAGMLIFFPVALAGLFLLDSLINKKKKRVKREFK